MAHKNPEIGLNLLVTRSVCPSVCRWYAVEGVSWILRSAASSLEKLDWLPLAEFAYNNHIHSTTCHTLFELDSGQHPWMGSEPTQSSCHTCHSCMTDFRPI